MTRLERDEQVAATIGDLIQHAITIALADMYGIEPDEAVQDLFQQEWQQIARPEEGR